jgi:hypothetical protein
LVIAPDLSYEIIESLGYTFHLNPQIFLTHLCDVRTNIIQDLWRNDDQGRNLDFFSPGTVSTDLKDLGTFKIDCNTGSTIHDIIPLEIAWNRPKLADERRRLLKTRIDSGPGLKRRYQVSPQLFRPPAHDNILHDTRETSLDFVTLDRMTVCSKLNQTVPTSM